MKHKIKVMKMTDKLKKDILVMDSSILEKEVDRINSVAVVVSRTPEYDYIMLYNVNENSELGEVLYREEVDASLHYFESFQDYERI